MSKPINIGEIFERTNTTFQTHFSYLAALAGIFIALGYLISTVGESLIMKFEMSALIIVMLISITVYAKLAIMVHRLVILNEKGFGYIFQWRSVELKFIGWILAIIGVLAVLMFFTIRISLSGSPSHTGGGFGSGLLVVLALMVVLGVIFSRFALIFPATAANKKLTLGDSWQLTSQHKFFMFFLAILVPYVTNRIFQKISTEQWLLVLLVEVLAVLVIIYEVGLISHAYEALGNVKEDNHSDQSS